MPVGVEGREAENVAANSYLKFKRVKLVLNRNLFSCVIIMFP